MSKKVTSSRLTLAWVLWFFALPVYLLFAFVGSFWLDTYPFLKMVCDIMAVVAGAYIFFGWLPVIIINQKGKNK